jgi:hypothetical protein
MHFLKERLSRGSLFFPFFTVPAGVFAGRVKMFLPTRASRGRFGRLSPTASTVRWHTAPPKWHFGRNLLRRNTKHNFTVGKKCEHYNVITKIDTT